MRQHPPQFVVLSLFLVALLPGGAARAEAESPVLTLDGPALLAPPTTLPKAIISKTAPAVEVCVIRGLPGDAKGTLWSSWGDGVFASNGRYYLGIGNHLDFGAGRGESRVYEYDPAAKALKLVVSVRDVVKDADRPAGKIHAKIDEGADGRLYFATYWGKDPVKSGAADFKGAALLAYDPKTGKTEDLGVPVPGQGVPTSILDPKRMILHGYAVRSGDYFAYDLAKRELKFRGGAGEQEGDRNIILDKAGNAYFGRKDGHLARYSPETGQLTTTKARLPQSGRNGDGESQSFLRASTRPAKNGTVYAMTKSGRFFAFDPAAESVKDLGPNLGGEYTAAMVLSPDDRFVYYAPGAHGSGSRIGTPVVQYDVAKGTHKVLAFLNPVLRERLNYNIGGTYNLQISPDGADLYFTFNGAMLDPGARREETFGLPSVVVVHVPKEER